MKNPMKLLISIISLTCALFWGCASVTIADSNVSLLTDAQRAYCSLSQAERRELFANADFRKGKMQGEYQSVNGRKTYWPKPLRFDWMAKPGVEYAVTVRDVKKDETVFAETVKCGCVEVDNLEIATTYRWQAVGGGETFTGEFTTADEPPRLLRFPGVPNVRDLGGRIGLKGHRIRQGLVFRSAGLNEQSSGQGKDLSQWKVGHSRVEGEKGEYIRSRFGIKTDIDLRSDEEVAGMSASPLGPSVKWCHISSAAYGGMQGKWGRSQFKEVFKVFLDRTNYPIDFHCVAGQDRTGAVAFILGALLGLDENILALDWEFTGFWNSDLSFRHEKLYDYLVDGFKKRYPAPTIRESVEKYVLSLGFTDADIEAFRLIMLDGYETEKDLRVAVYVGPGACGLGTLRHVQIGECARGVEMVLVDDVMINEDVLKSVNVLVMPGGSSPAMVKALGKSGVDKLRTFVAEGGGYIGTCAGAIVGSVSVPGYREGMANLAPYATRENIARSPAEVLINYTPEAAEFLGNNFVGHQRVSYSWGPIFTPTNQIEGTSFKTLALYDSEYLDKERLAMLGKVAIAAGTYYKGRVFLSAVHPEVDLDDHNLLCAALRYVSGHDTSWNMPQRARRGQLSVAIGADQSLGVKSVATILKIMRDKAFDVSFEGISTLANGYYDWVDVMVIPPSNNPPEIPSVGLGENLNRTKAFLLRGGKIVVWGPFANDYAMLGSGVSVVKDGDEAMEVLHRIERETNPIEVACYAGTFGTCEEIAGVLALTPGFHVKIVTDKEILNGALRKTDLLVLLGDRSCAESAYLDAEVAAEIVRFVREGGAYYGIGSGALLSSPSVEHSSSQLNFVPWKDAFTSYPGAGDVKIKLTDAGEGVLGCEKERMVAYRGGPLFEPAEPVLDTEIDILATFDWHIIGTAINKDFRPMDGKPAILAGRVGKGKVYLQSPQPELSEATFDLVRSALKYLTERDVTGEMPKYRRGQLVVGCEAPHDPNFAKFFLKLIGYHNVFYRNIGYGHPANDMKRLDVLIIAKPTKQTLERASVRSFSEFGRLIFVVAETEEERALCKDIPGILVVHSYDRLLSHFER